MLSMGHSPMTSESSLFILLKPELLVVHHDNMEAQYSLPWHRGSHAFSVASLPGRSLTG